MREVVDCKNIPILIDQEGGTVSRLKEPVWKEFPKAESYARLAEKSLDDAKSAVYTNYKAMAQEIAELDISVNCAPVMDLPSDKCHQFLRPRTYSYNFV